MSGISQTFVEPYAEALMEVAKSQNLVEEFGANVQLVLDILASSSELSGFLASPVVKLAAKKDLLRKAIAEQVNPVMLNFLLLLVDRQRVIFLKPICQQFQAMLRKLKRVALAEVTTAVELSADQLETLRRKVQALTSCDQVELAIKVEPALIGGVIVKVGSQVIDASIRGQLRRLSSSLVAGI
ncbi:MAG: ATP synthase F1 subunit delta [Pseudanabaenaceae cyanobacterium bins.68]|nr:ATP synthase F1 subunit delta [Pseudanabaenaceae cyanobacterium bins.68]